MKHPSTSIEQKEDESWTFNGKRACIKWQRTWEAWIQNVSKSIWSWTLSSTLVTWFIAFTKVISDPKNLDRIY